MTVDVVARKIIISLKMYISTQYACVEIYTFNEIIVLHVKLTPFRAQKFLFGEGSGPDRPCCEDTLSRLLYRCIMLRSIMDV